MAADERTCFQCGRPRELVLRPDMGPDDWFTCEGCGERIMTVADFVKRVNDAEEERISRALGVRDFKPSSGRTG